MGPGTDLGGLGWFAVVWATMMAAMMLPSLVPMALTYAAASRRARARAPDGGDVLFAAGYLLGVAAARGCSRTALIEGVGSLDVSVARVGPRRAVRRGRRDPRRGALRADAGEGDAACATAATPSCSPGAGAPAPSGACSMGLEHGGFCVGSSWALMAALFAVGVMNVGLDGRVAAVVAIEKLLPWDERRDRRDGRCSSPRWASRWRSRPTRCRG